MAQPPVIDLCGLVVLAGARTILDGASLQIPQGQLCLLVGRSGSGKSVTLALLAGLLTERKGLAIQGKASVLGHDVLSAGPAPRTAVVFQDFALFDDWDAATNIAFALDHGAAPPESRAGACDALLHEFGLRAEQRPARMSGGEKQRLAIARALALQPELILYDEPTSGLDPAMSRAVAARIRAVHEQHGMTSLVVTHDLVALLPIADRIVLLDPATRRFVDVSQAEVDSVLSRLSTSLPETVPPSAPPAAAAGARLRSGLLAGVDATGGFVMSLGRTLAGLVPRFPRARWGWRFVRGYLHLLALGSALPFMALAGLIAGFVVSFFLFHLIPYAGFTEPVILEEILSSLGFALFRVVVPGTVTLLFAARGGAAIAADLGHRVYTRQTDALLVQRTPPLRYLGSAIAIATLAAAPVVAWLAWKAAALAALIVFLGTHPGQVALTFSENFPRLIGGSTVLNEHLAWALGKVVACFLGTAAIAYDVGTRPKLSGDDLARGVTATIIRTTTFVLCVHLLFAVFEF